MTDQREQVVGDMMTPTVQSIERTATVHEAIELMREAGVSSLAVERRDEADEYGLLVVSDIAREVIAQNRSADRVNVYEIMSKPVITLPADMKIRYAVRLLVKFELARALVVDPTRKPIGIITLRDMVIRQPKD